jgi:hypothetical protein
MHKQRADGTAVLADKVSESVPQMPSSVAWRRLRVVNGELQMTLQLLASGDALRPGVASPELIAMLTAYLEEVGQLRSSGQLGETGLQAEAEWRDYRTTLERLNRILPKIERQLQDDRSRLAQEQERLSRASAWTFASKLTR